MSLVNKTNKRGPKIEPCGVPDVTAAEEDVAPRKEGATEKEVAHRNVTDCERSVKLITFTII